MTDETTDPGPSWLSCLPDGATVSDREIRECTVTALFDGYFSARVKGERRRDYFDLALVAAEDKPFLVVGARFWLVVERVAGRPGGAYSALAFQRPGAATAEQAFAARRAPASDLPIHPASPKGAP